MEHLPPSQEFFTQLPIYKPIDVTEISPLEVADIIYYEKSIDCVCPFCKEKKESIFNSIAVRPSGGSREISESSRFALILTNIGNGFKAMGEPEKHEYKDNYFSVNFKCARNENHIISFHLMIFNNKLMKIGQFPSVNHIKNSNFERFDSVIGKVKVQELKKGEMCHGMNLGTGALSYIRKVFEYVIENIHVEAKSSSDWSPEKEEEYSKIRFVKKVEMLEKWLPSFVVQNKKTYYAVISDGIHNMSDEDCMDAYDTLKGALELILDEILRDKDKKDKEKELSAALGQLHSKKK